MSGATSMGAGVDMLLPARFREPPPGTPRALRRGRGTPAPMGSGMELFGLHRNGSEFPVEIGLSPIHDAGRMLVAAAIRDVSEHRQAQNELLAARPGRRPRQQRQEPLPGDGKP